MLLTQKLTKVLRRDRNADASGIYRVRSLYFDNFDDKVLMEKAIGIGTREKFRIRYYGEDTANIKLEKKTKINGLCIKQSAPIAKRTVQALLLGEYKGLLDEEQPLQLELYAKMHSQLLRPRAIVDYAREAYVYPPGNVRVTIDFDIRASSDIARFLTHSYVGANNGQTVLEVKYDAFLPNLVRDILQMDARKSTSYSKYAMSRML